MWDLPGTGIEPLTPALAGGFFTTEPPGKSFFTDYIHQSHLVNKNINNKIVAPQKDTPNDSQTYHEFGF